MQGKLYLIPTTLGDSKINSVIPPDVSEIIEELQFFIVENIRTARRYIRKISRKKNIDELTFFEIGKHTDFTNISHYLDPAQQGKSIGLLSEAGNPCIADPGNEIVKIAHRKNIQVVPLVGPSSILLALIASGMNGQNFAFNGYLPVQKSDKIKKIKSLENRSRNENQSQIFMETPYRNQNFLEDILNTCNKTTRLCIAADITLETEFINTKTIADWKKNKPNLKKRPTIFILQAN